MNTENAITFSGKRNSSPCPPPRGGQGEAASKLAVPIRTYLKQYAPSCPASFSLSLAQILRLHPKNKNQMHFSGEYK